MRDNVVDLQAHQPAQLPAADDVVWIAPMARVIVGVERVFGLRKHQVQSPRRVEKLLASRQCAVWCGREMDVAFGIIADALNRDRSTLWNTLRRAEKRRRCDRHFVDCCDAVLRIAGGACDGEA